MLPPAIDSIALPKLVPYASILSCYRIGRDGPTVLIQTGLDRRGSKMLKVQTVERSKGYGDQIQGPLHPENEQDGLCGDLNCYPFVFGLNHFHLALWHLESQQ